MLIALGPPLTVYLFGWYAIWKELGDDRAVMSPWESAAASFTGAATLLIMIMAGVGIIVGWLYLIFSFWSAGAPQ